MKKLTAARRLQIEDICDRLQQRMLQNPAKPLVDTVLDAAATRLFPPPHKYIVGEFGGVDDRTLHACLDPDADTSIYSDQCFQHFEPLISPSHPNLPYAQGCLMGQCVGDSLGSLVEFRSARRIAEQYGPQGPQELEHGGTYGTRAGQPTDDTEMALMLARDLVAEGRYNADTVAQAYIYWHDSGPFDIGCTTDGAMHGLRHATQDNAVIDYAVLITHQNQQSQANGALMRVSPIGVAFAHADAAWDAGEADSRLTHPHAVCKLANAAYSYAVSLLVHRTVGPAYSPQDTARCIVDMVCAQLDRRARRDSAAAEVRRWIGEAAEGRPPTEYLHQQGWVKKAFSLAFFELLHAPSFTAGVRDAVRRGGDTDTNGAITGALLGALYGLSEIPPQWRESVLTCESRSGLSFPCQPRPRDFWPTDVLELAAALFNLQLT